MTDAMLSWGSSLLAKGDKIMRPDSEVEDFSTRYLGYWTDAGYVDSIFILCYLDDFFYFLRTATLSFLTFLSLLPLS